MRVVNTTEMKKVAGGFFSADDNGYDRMGQKTEQEKLIDRVCGGTHGSGGRITGGSGTKAGSTTTTSEIDTTTVGGSATVGGGGGLGGTISNTTGTITTTTTGGDSTTSTVECK